MKRKQIVSDRNQEEFALFLRPGEIKWHLMVASCYRRSGDYQAAFEKYKWIHQHFPEDIDCKEARHFEIESRGKTLKRADYSSSSFRNFI